MSAAERCGRLLVIALIGTLVGCAGSHGSRCSDPVATGDYTFAILSFLSGPHFGLGFDLSVDGTFEGHFGEGWPGAPARCDGILTPDESERITAAINTGQMFCRSSTFDGERDGPYHGFELRTIDGLRENRFCDHNIVLPDPLVSELMGAAEAALVRVRDSGGCMGEPYEIPFRTGLCIPPP